MKNMALRTRVVLLDDHVLVRNALAERLSREDDFDVVGGFASTRELMAALQAATVPIDVAVIDYSLGPADIDGASLIRALRVRFASLKVLVVSGHDNSPTISLARQAGAHGFVGKGQNERELISAIRTVARGGLYVDRDALADFSGSSINSDSLTDVRALTGQAKLSPREREVLRCCLDGMRVSAIAEKFCRNINTISSQKQSALRKLGISGDHEMFKIKHLIDKGI